MLWNSTKHSQTQTQENRWGIEQPARWLKTSLKVEQEVGSSYVITLSVWGWTVWSITHSVGGVLDMHLRCMLPHSIQSGEGMAAARRREGSNWLRSRACVVRMATQQKNRPENMSITFVGQGMEMHFLRAVLMSVGWTISLIVTGTQSKHTERTHLNRFTERQWTHSPIVTSIVSFNAPSRLVTRGLW